jgi:hypothetical protein
VTFKFSLVSAVLLSSFSAAGLAQAQSATQNVNLSEKLKIPGASLKPGEYTFSVEDRLEDRAIVRITSQDQSKHFLVLTVPSAKLPQQGADGLVRFTTANGKDQILRGWACPGCTPTLEFVYPKAEAAQLTDETAEAVLAVDPAYDKLPANLSPDDMKVVTLWLLSPERITANNKGKGVKAEKYASASRPAADAQSAAASTSEVAQVPVAAAAGAPAGPVAPAGAAAQPAEMASASRAARPVADEQTAQRMPKTASNNYLYVFGGMLLMIVGLGLRLGRRLAFSR